MKFSNGASPSMCAQRVGEAAGVGHQVPVAGEAHQPLHGRRSRSGSVARMVYGGYGSNTMPNSSVWRMIGVPRRRLRMPNWISCGSSATSWSKPRAKLAMSSPGRPAIRSTCRWACECSHSQRMLSAALSLSCRRLTSACTSGLKLWMPISNCSAPGGNLRDAFLQRVGQVVGHQLEVGVDRVVRVRFQLVEEELHDLQAGLDVQVEGAVDELEQARAARVQRFQLAPGRRRAGTARRSCPAPTGRTRT